MITPLALGATMYTPATNTNMYSVVSKELNSGLHTVIICLEDAVLDSDIPRCLFNLQGLLNRLAITTDGYTNIFIRPKNIEVLKQILLLDNIEFCNGFVIPKATLENINDWMELISDQYQVMPTLETKEVFDTSYLTSFATTLALDYKKQILCMRIGANDLFSCLSLRRPRNKTIYQTVLAPTLANIATIFSPLGFSIAAPVFEHFSDIKTFQEEVEQDIEHGFLSKTLIHPSQIEMLTKHLAVSLDDYKDANLILTKEFAVMKNHGSMLEPATHLKWARSILERSNAYGIKEDLTSMVNTLDILVPDTMNANSTIYF